MLLTYVDEKTPFSFFNGTLMLDDITVGYIDSEKFTFIPRGNTINENDVVNSDNLNVIIEYILDYIAPQILSNEIKTMSIYTQTESPKVFQAIALCEVGENGKPGQMIFAIAFRGCTIEKQHFLDNMFTCQGIRHEQMKRHRPEVNGAMLEYASKYYPTCITLLKNYLKKRDTQINRTVKPRISLIQKANPDCGGSRVMCLATGFYPRHINLTLFRDGQPVSDDEIIGGDLLPNDDGTYQMRKTLEISEEEKKEKHKYTCTATHLSLDNKLDFKLDYPGRTLTSDPDSVLCVFIISHIVCIVCIIIVYYTQSRAGFWIFIVICKILFISQLPVYRLMYKALYKIYTTSWD
ncbi:T-cell surface glycoprotein CD1b3-like [Misgurnus anguillicaudatus]|uniref:T-cell surface glycoprotein CD1b3-like n=1 Tax=Misgurnus anguillicaudatus TaxID=75329 RepID=UPI003CCF9700